MNMDLNQEEHILLRKTEPNESSRPRVKKYDVSEFCEFISLSEHILVTSPYVYFVENKAM